MTTLTKNAGTPLTEWLNDLTRRGCTITVTDRVVQVRGVSARDTDRHQVNRHRHALELAAQGDHPAWWTHAIGRGPTPQLTDLPTVDDPDDRWGGWGFPCACCGRPADRLDGALLPWCREHAA